MAKLLAVRALLPTASMRVQSAGECLPARTRKVAQTLGFSWQVEGWSARQPRAFQRCAMPGAPSS